MASLSPKSEIALRRRGLYKATTPPWKETLRNRCYAKFQKARERLVDTFRQMPTSTEIREKSYSLVNDIIDEEWKELCQSAEFRDMNYYEVLQLEEQLRKELKEEEERLIEYRSLVDIQVEETNQMAESMSQVSCPVCQKNILCEYVTHIGCPCGVKLYDRFCKLSLDHLKFRLNEVLNFHSSHCHQTPTFSTKSDSDKTSLVIFCSVAGGHGCPVTGHGDGVRPIWLRNPVTETELVDTLHAKAVGAMQCGKGQCSAAIVSGQTIPGGSCGVPKPPFEVLTEAEEFFQEYFASLDLKDGPEHLKRVAEVTAEIQRTGTYDLTLEELTFGARLAWRNSARCVARMFWNKLEIFDCRHVTSAEEMAEALIRHVEYGLNGGNIRAAITVFPQRKSGREDFRMWNSQFFNYAGYPQPDGSVIGDPQNVPLTKACQQLGWKGKGTRFDIIPLVVSAPGQDPHLFELPQHLCMEVPIRHPTLSFFDEMDLRWYALPAVADMRLDVGGLEFTAAPFNGWYTSPEIGTRNFCDSHRYNLMEEVAKRMGLDTSTNKSLWKDKAMVHLNVAVLHSYQQVGVSIVDHHTASDAYGKFMVSEHATRGGCPSDWVWLVPPISGALTSLYHQEMVLYKLRPSYEYQERAWKDFLKPEETKFENAT